MCVVVVVVVVVAFAAIDLREERDLQRLSQALPDNIDEIMAEMEAEDVQNEVGDTGGCRVAGTLAACILCLCAQRMDAMRRVP